MSSRYLIPLAVAAALAAPVAANAQEGTYDPGKWLVRVGISQINPDSYNLDLGNGAAVVVDSDLSPTGTIEYMITPHIGTELLLAWPATHGLDLDAGGRPLDRVAHVDVLPPTLSLNWHFNPNGTFRPYIGAGVNYTLFSGEETQGVAAGSSLKLDDSIGAAGQVGVDIGNKTSNWFFNANVRYIDMSSDVELDGSDIGSAELNPWVYGLHVGYRFGHVIPAPAPAPAPVVAPPPPPPPPPAKCADMDNDGVCDEADKCPGTPAGTKVDSVGCPLEQTLKLLFDFDSAELRPESITELERVVKFMGDVPFAKAMVEGHTDSVGADAYNAALSDRRAKAVFDYLSSRGVDPARLSSVGKGETAPIADNATAEGRQENRRVMLIRTDSGM
ncbi:MAG: OmpA family protein [Gammaproteobacteria bacterium]|nr:OmpA family protein [Gammaproteobacteria bacterium]